MQTLPPEVDVVDVPGGVRYSLPRRTRQVRRFGQALAVSSLALSAIFLLLAVADPAVMAFARIAPPAAWLFRAASGLTALHLIALGGIGLLLWQGTSEVNLRDGRLAAVERLGLFRWARSRSIISIDRVVVAPMPWIPSMHTEQGESSMLLRVACLDRRRMLAALGYPEDWLTALADDLNHRCAEWLQQQTLASEQSDAEATSSAANQPPRPAGTGVVLSRHADYLQLTIPGRDVGLAEGVQVAAAVELFAFAMLPACFALAPQAQGARVALLCFAAAPAAGALGLILAVVRRFREKMTLEATANRLTCASQGLFLRRRVWPRAAIRGILATGAHPDYQKLCVWLADERQVVLLNDRLQAEVEWMAAVLRQALGLRETRVDEPPPGCPIRIQRHEDGLTARVPPTGLQGKGYIGQILIGLAILGLGIGMGAAAASPAKRLLDTYVFCFFCAVSSGVGFLLIADAVQVAREQAVLAVVSGRLLVLSASLFGHKRREWARDEVMAIRVGWHMSQGKISGCRLSITAHRGPSFHLLEGQREEDLQWLAAALRGALQLDDNATAESGAVGGPGALPHLPGDALARALQVTATDESLRLAWNNRLVPKDWCTMGCFLIFWIIWAPVTLVFTVQLVLGIGPTCFLAVWLVFGWLGTLGIPLSFLSLWRTESLEITPSLIRCDEPGLWASRPTTCPTALRPILSFGHHARVAGDGVESNATINLEWTAPSGSAKRVMIGYWMATDAKADLFATVEGYVQAHDIPLGIQWLEM